MTVLRKTSLGSFAFYTDSKNIIILKPWTIELAKDNAKGSINHYADKYAKKANRDVENRFDKLYQEIKQKYKPRN
jgi:hypothetical protein